MNNIQLKEKVTQKISSSTELIQNLVIDKYVEFEVNRRAELIYLGINILDKLQKDFVKNDRPDIEEYDSNKNKVIKFSKNKIEQLQKDKTLIDNLNTTLETCIGSNTDETYLKLDGLLKQFKSENKQSN